MVVRRTPTLLAIGALLASLCVAAAVLGIPVPQRMLDIDRMLPPGTTQTHAATRYYPFSGLTVVTGLVIHQGGQVTATAAAAGIAGYRTTGDGQTLGRLDVRDITVMLPTGTIAAARIEAAHFTIRPAALAAIGANPLQNWRPIARNIDCAKLNIRDVSASFPGGAGGIDHIDLRSYRSGALTDLSIGGVTLAWQSPAPGAPIIHAALHLLHAQDFTRRWLDPVYTADAATLRADIQPGTPQRVSLQDLSITSHAFTVRIARLASSSTYDASANMRGSETIEGGQINLPKTPGMSPSPIAQALKLDGMTFSGGVLFSFDKPALRTSFGPFTLSFAGLGTFEMTMSVTADAARYRPGLPNGFVFETAKLQWHDSGLANRLLQFNADRQHLGLEQVRAIVEGAAERTGGALLANQPDAGSQLAAFVDKPGTLTLDLNPPVPIAFEAFPTVPKLQWPAVLGMHLSAN